MHPFAHGDGECNKRRHARGKTICTRAPPFSQPTPYALMDFRLSTAHGTNKTNFDKNGSQRERARTFSISRLLVVLITPSRLVEIAAGPTISTTPFRPWHATVTTCASWSSDMNCSSSSTTLAQAAAVMAGSGNASPLCHSCSGGNTCGPVTTMWCWESGQSDRSKFNKTRRFY